MSRNTRASSSNLKHKESKTGISMSAREQEQSNAKSIKLVLKEEKVCPAEEERDMLRLKSVEAGPRVRYVQARRRAMSACQMLDMSIRYRRNTIDLKKSLTTLKKELCAHLKIINNRLMSCQESNKRLEEEVKELKMALSHHSSEDERTNTSNTKTAKMPRPHTVVVSAPDHIEDTNHLDNSKEEGVNDFEEALIVDHAHSVDNPTVSQNAVGNFTFITLNTQEDFPEGSWLGDESNPQMRVRCQIPPSDMLHIMNMHKTPEKLALKLLDLLFDKETQATSNLSGTGKHKKTKLDPLLIYGIHCHLVKHFNINSEDWYRIRLNIDSKCRTAFRRKQKGLNLYPKHVKRIKREPVTLAGTAFSTQSFQHSNAVQHILQSISGEGLSDITIIQEDPERGTTVETATVASVAGHSILSHEGVPLQADQLKEVISQASTANKIHLSMGQTIAISESGELEIREGHIEESK